MTTTAPNTSSKPEFNPSGDPVVAEIKRQGDRLMQLITESVPASRRRSIALTELEGALMWAVKATVYPGE